jgi:uncharacterized protein YndB with AHSA1/START domain
MQPVHVEHDLLGDPDAVFEWFVDPVLLVRWWPTEAVTDPVVGGRYRMYWDAPDVTLRGEYVEVVFGERLRFTWQWDHEARLAPRDVEIEFAASARGTLVSVTHECESEEEGVGYLDGWTHFLAQLDARIAAA